MKESFKRKILFEVSKGFLDLREVAARQIKTQTCQSTIDCSD